ncbi:RES family NAD+ phosphorylase [Tunicatimonas pelagia]|uniref:RES family NAD+ phosphorylase n=1 Tax=Tunicatimonas pelagia TaxID=931531 RepID=UPI0026660316|nr:RES family NAD+ phosphorylase [Tunicatimonas pelagia]WKN46068.1 RES family NAD+ phosphorylase [Tunicatimonas pelagia]
MLKVYRITKAKHGRDLSGTGAYIYGGRWNTPAIHMLYTANSVALATLESLAHLRRGITAQKFALVELGLPNQEYPSVEGFMELPPDWTIPPPYAEGTRSVGKSAWFQEYLAIRVPSVIMQKDENYLLNPLHPDMQEVEILSVGDYNFDRRLLS